MAEFERSTRSSGSTASFEWRCSIIEQVDDETTRVRLADGSELFDLCEEETRARLGAAYRTE